MKKFLFTAVLLVAAYLTQAQQVTIDGETRPNTDFSKYKSYTWASQVDNRQDPGNYFLNDVELKDRIRNAVGYAMDGRGYKLNREAPDLLVNFRVFDKPTKIQGYTGYGSDYFSASEIQSADNTTTFDVKAGSIVVNLIDLKSGQVVWRGLASGLTNTNGFDRTDNNIREAVNLIFNRYEYRADKY